MGKVIDLTGRRFGRLVVINRAENAKQGQSRWKCKCDCGNETIVAGQSLREGKIISCGCYRKDLLKYVTITHNDSSTRLYKIWGYIKKRTSNRNCRDYTHYGKRGILICVEWEMNFLAFKEWALKTGYTDDLTIDRIDNSKGYSPDNCRWVNMKIQANNKSTNRRITYKGETKTLAEWGQLIGGNITLVRDRIDRLGWSIEKALTTPVRKKKRKQEDNR